MKVIIIVAACKQNKGIGKDNQLLWHLPADMKFFKEATMGFPIITGRKNYESIPERYRPLPGRLNIVLTRDQNYLAEGAEVVHSLNEGLRTAEADNQDCCFIIGGGQIYQEALDRKIADEMFVTWVDAELKADTFLSGFDPDEWEVKSEDHHEKDDKNSYSFTIVKYTRKFRA